MADNHSDDLIKTLLDQFAAVNKLSVCREVIAAIRPAEEWRADYLDPDEEDCPSFETTEINGLGLAVMGRLGEPIVPGIPQIAPLLLGLMDELGPAPDLRKRLETELNSPNPFGGPTGFRGVFTRDAKYSVKSLRHANRLADLLLALEGLPALERKLRDRILAICSPKPRLRLDISNPMGIYFDDEHFLVKKESTRVFVDMLMEAQGSTVTEAQVIERIRGGRFRTKEAKKDLPKKISSLITTKPGGGSSLPLDRWRGLAKNGL